MTRMNIANTAAMAISRNASPQDRQPYVRMGRVYGDWNAPHPPLRAPSPRSRGTKGLAGFGARASRARLGWGRARDARAPRGGQLGTLLPLAPRSGREWPKAG